VRAGFGPIKEVRAKAQQAAKGKKKKDLQRDEIYQDLRREENRIVGVIQAFRRVADAMAWQTLGMNKVLMRPYSLTRDVWHALRRCCEGYPTWRSSQKQLIRKLQFAYQSFRMLSHDLLRC
jgi:hypothetical protein